MYELLIVSKVSESDGLLSRIEKALTDANAVEVKTDKLGKKQLAYPIKKETEADYTVLTFGAEGAAISNLTGMLRLEQEALLRYLITVQKTRKLRKKVRRVEEKAVEKKEEKKPKVTVVTKTSVKGSFDKTQGKRVKSGETKMAVKATKGTKGTKVSKVKVASKGRSKTKKK